MLYCLTNFLYEFENGKSTLNNSALTLLLRNKLCTWLENKHPETFSVSQLSLEIWNRCIVSVYFLMMSEIYENIQSWKCCLFITIYRYSYYIDNQYLVCAQAERVAKKRRVLITATSAAKFWQDLVLLSLWRRISYCQKISQIPDWHNHLLIIVSFGKE